MTLLNSDPLERYGAAMTGESLVYAEPPDCGLVYFFRMGPTEDGPIKIGWTRDRDALDRRLRTLQIGNPLKLHCIGTVPGSRRTEKRLHARYRAHAVRGEWFRAAAELVCLAESANTTCRGCGRGPSRFVLLPEPFTGMYICAGCNLTIATVAFPKTDEDVELVHKYLKDDRPGQLAFM